jgi:hypothetical protein
MEKWETPINSNTDSFQCSDSNSGSYKTVIRAPKKCPRKSTSASMYNLNSYILRFPFFFLYLVHFTLECAFFHYSKLIFFFVIILNPIIFV